MESAMIISFFGHRAIYGEADLSSKIKNTILDNIPPWGEILFYCGGYGDFDSLCASVCRSIKQTHPEIELIFVTPYIHENKLKSSQYLLDNRMYDSILYPPLEGVPPRFAIVQRNRWIVEQSDLIIAFVKRKYGGAYNALKYANRINKRIINLAHLII